MSDLSQYGTRLSITKDDKRTCIGFFYLRPVGWEFGEIKCNVWTGPKGVICWDGAAWHSYSDYQHNTVVDDRISGS